MSADGQKSKAELRAERRQLQEEQRAAKAAKQSGSGGPSQSNPTRNEAASSKQKDVKKPQPPKQQDSSSAQIGKPVEKESVTGELKKDNEPIRAESSEKRTGRPGATKSNQPEKRPGQDRPEKTEIQTEKRSMKPGDKGDKQQTERNDEKVERKVEAKDREQRRTRDTLRLDDPHVARRRTKQLKKLDVPERMTADRKVPFFAHLQQFADSPTHVMRELSFSADSPVHPPFVRLALLSAYEPSRPAFVPNRTSAIGSDCTLHVDSNKRTFMLADALRIFIEDITSGLLRESANDVPLEDRIDELVNRLEKRLPPNLIFIKQFRPLSVSESALVKLFKKQLTTERQRNLEARKSIVDRASVDRETKSTVVSDKKLQTSAQPEGPIRECTERIIENLLEFLKVQILLAHQAISECARKKLNKKDHVLTFGFSSCVLRVLVDYQQQLNKEEELRGNRDTSSPSAGMSDFGVIVLDDARSSRGGLLMADALLRAGVQRVEYGCITAVGQHVGRCTKVLLGADSLLANGSVVAPCGTALVALVARTRMLPVLVLVEGYKVSENVQQDAFVNNDLRDPDALVRDCVCARGELSAQSAPASAPTTKPVQDTKKQELPGNAAKPNAAAVKKDENTSEPAQPVSVCHAGDWRKDRALTLLNLASDVCPPQFVSAIITQSFGMLPCTSAPILLRRSAEAEMDAFSR